MRRSKGLAVLTLLAIVLFTTGCAASTNASTPTVEKKTVPFVLQMDPDEDATESEMNLYFFDGSDVPYAAISEFIPFYGGLYEDEDTGSPAIEFEITNDGDSCYVLRTDTEWSMTVDAQKDEIGFTGYDGFLQAPGDTALVGLVKVGEGGYWRSLGPHEGQRQLLQSRGPQYHLQAVRLLLLHLP